MTIKSRIIVLNVLVAMITLSLGGVFVYQSYFEARQLRNFNQLSILLREMFQLGNAWTIESGGVWHAHRDFCVPGKLAEGRKEYSDVIAKSQAVVKDIEATVAAMPLDELSPSFRDMVQNRFDFEKRLTKLRDGIVVDNVHPWQTTLLYNREIKRLFGMISQLATETSDAELVRKVMVADLTLQARLMIDRHGGLLSYALGSGDVNESLARFPAFVDDMRPLLSRIETLTSAEGVKLFKQYIDNDAFRSFEEATDLVLKAGPPPASGRHTFDKTMAAKIKKDYLQHGKEMNNFTEFVQADVQNYTQHRLNEANLKMYASLSVVGLALLLSCAGSFFTVRHITRSIRSVSLQLEEASQTNNDLSLQVSTAASELADGCSAQASAIEEIHSTVESITSLATDENKRVERVLQLAEESDVSVAESSSSTKKMRAAMQRIQDSNSKIANITKTIEEIAFQTNILSLNAAVEAARAGEAGAGFAIVAEEVRNLAHKSAESAKSTHLMIDNAIHSVNEGNALSEELEKQLTFILAQIGSFKEAMRALKDGSVQQRTAIAQVSSAMGDIEKATQHNASAAEESAAAAHEMEAQSQTVLQQIRYLEAILIGMRNGLATAPQSTDNQTA